MIVKGFEIMLDLNLIKTDLITVEEIEFIQELSTYRFPNRVYQEYIHSTKDNKNTKYGIAKKKIIRDIILAKEAPVKIGLEYKKVFYYGNMIIQLNTVEKSICFISNCEGRFHFHLDREKRSALNEIMGLR